MYGASILQCGMRCFPPYLGNCFVFLLLQHLKKYATLESQCRLAECVLFVHCSAYLVVNVCLHVFCFCLRIYIYVRACV